jgi:hypothetical protein
MRIPLIIVKLDVAASKRIAWSRMEANPVMLLRFLAFVGVLMAASFPIESTRAQSSPPVWKFVDPPAASANPKLWRFADPPAAAAPIVDCPALIRAYNAVIEQDTKLCIGQKYRPRIAECMAISTDVIARAQSLLKLTATCTTLTKTDLIENIRVARANLENQRLAQQEVRGGRSNSGSSRTQNCRVVSQVCTVCGDNPGVGNNCFSYTCNSRSICD